jgi:hypothetical protein
MKHTSRAAALALGLVTATLVVSASANAAPAAFDTAASGTGDVVTDAAGNAIAVAAARTAPNQDQAFFRYRHVNGRWSGQYAVPGLGLGLAEVAQGRVGMPMVVGHLKGLSLTGVVAVIRRTDASWTPPVRLNTGLAGAATTVGVAGNADGDFAVSWTQFTSGAATGTTYAAIRLRGGSWHTYAVGGLTDFRDNNSQPATRVGIDSYGNVTVARTVTSSGSTTHRLLTRRKPLSGGWQAQHQVSGAGQSVRWHDMVIEPTGRETLAYQLVNSTSPRYGDSYVLRQASVGSGLGQVWHQTASSPPSIAAAGGRLRVVWATISGTDPAHGFTRAFNPTAGPVRDLGSDPADVTAVTINKYGAGVVATGAGSHGVVHPVTPASLGAAQPIDPTADEIVALHPVLGAAPEFFVGADTQTAFGSGPGFFETLQVFRGSLS